MAESKVLRVAPVRNGMQLATAWRIWTQGDEFYAAQKSSIGFSKISFHRNGNWQLAMGAHCLKLGPGMNFGHGWTLALQIAFLVDDGVSTPPHHQDDQFSEVVVGRSSRMNLNLMIAESAHVFQRGLPISGALVKAFLLRSGRFLVVSSELYPLSDSNFTSIRNIRTQLEVNLDSPPQEPFYVEAVSSAFEPAGANIISVIPVGDEVLRF